MAPAAPQLPSRRPGAQRNARRDEKQNSNISKRRKCKHAGCACLCKSVQVRVHVHDAVLPASCIIAPSSTQGPTWRATPPAQFSTSHAAPTYGRRVARQSSGGSVGASMHKGFISYAHDDHAAFAELRTHLKPIERAFEIDFWADKRITPGEYWSKKIADRIEAARVHVLMISPAFMASDYIYDNELPAINEKCSKGDMVLPILVVPCIWEFLVGSLQAAPVDPTGRVLPMLDWKPQRNGFNAACRQIWSALEGRYGSPSKPPFSWGTL